MSLVARLRAQLQASGELRAGSAGKAQILVAVSGGADSSALLLLLHTLADEFGLQLLVAHVDHGIRPDSAEVASAVETTAAGLSIPCHVRVLALGSGASETMARDARYEALFALREELGADYVVTGHHADDQVETVLFRVLKGSGMLGLAGIRRSRPDGLVRPLLGFRRTEIREWLAAQPGIDGADRDPANVDLRHDRAWVRGELLPALRQRFGDEVDERLLRLGAYADSDRRAWSAVVRALPDLKFEGGEASAELARDALLGYDKPLSLAILRAVAHEAGCVVGPSRAERLFDFLCRSSSGHRFQIGEGWRCEIVFGRIRIYRSLGDSDSLPVVRWGTENGGCIQWGAWSITWTAGPAQRNVRAGGTTWVTLGPGEVRALRPGDRIRPLGGAGSRRVVRELMEGRVPRSEREVFPVLVRDQNVLWLPGICRSADAQPEPGSAALRLDVSHQ